MPGDAWPPEVRYLALGASHKAMHSVSPHRCGPQGIPPAHVNGDLTATDQAVAKPIPRENATVSFFLNATLIRTNETRIALLWLYALTKQSCKFLNDKHLYGVMCKP